MKTIIFSKEEVAAATADRKRQSALAKKCRCGNQATFGFDTCGGCREEESTRNEAAALLVRVYEADTVEKLHTVVIELAERLLS